MFKALLIAALMLAANWLSWMAFVAAWAVGEHEINRELKAIDLLVSMQETIVLLFAAALAVAQVGALASKIRTRFLLAPACLLLPFISLVVWEPGDWVTPLQLFLAAAAISTIFAVAGHGLRTLISRGCGIGLR